MKDITQTQHKIQISHKGFNIENSHHKRILE